MHRKLGQAIQNRLRANFCWRVGLRGFANARKSASVIFYLSFGTFANSLANVVLTIEACDFHSKAGGYGPGGKKTQKREMRRHDHHSVTWSDPVRVVPSSLHFKQPRSYSLNVMMAGIFLDSHKQMEIAGQVFCSQKKSTAVPLCVKSCWVWAFLLFLWSHKQMKVRRKICCQRKLRKRDVPLSELFQVGTASILSQTTLLGFCCNFSQANRKKP